MCEECENEVIEKKNTILQIEEGMKFGKWTVIKTGLRNKHKQKSSLCKCDCGRIELLITDTDLRRGKTTQCKQCYNESVDRPVEIGDKYGEWTVIEANIRNKRGALCSKVECSCGRTIKIRENARITSIKYPKCSKCTNEDKRLDIKIGQKFGSWTVLEIGIKNKRNQVCCKVACDCGRSIEIIPNSKLNNNKTTKCKKCSTNMKNINVGDKFGKWVVLKIGLKGKHGENMSLCECECKRTTMPIKNTSLANGSSTQCPNCVSGKIDLNNGDKYNNWTVIEANINKNKGHSRSKCRCDCGNIRVMRNSEIINNKWNRCNMCVDKTTEEYKNELKIVNPDVELKEGEEYKSNYVKIHHICSVCKSDWFVEPACILKGQKACGKCKDKITQSYMATALQQVLRYYYPKTEFEYDLGFKGEAGLPSKYDIYVEELNTIIECQSGYHDKKVEFDKNKKQFALNLGYEFIAIDSREYTPLKACKIFFPNITMKEMNKIVDWKRYSRRHWDLKEAQTLLDEGFTYREIAKKLDTSYNSINTAATNGLIKKPENYVRRTLQAKSIIQLDLEYNFIKEYRIASDTQFNKNSIHKACNNKGNYKDNPHKMGGYIWYYKEEYEKIKEKIVS